MKSFIKHRTRIFWLVLGFLLIAVIGSIDSQFPPEWIFSYLYIIPVSLLAWFVDRTPAMAAAVVSTIMWIAADVYTGLTYSSPEVYYWNTLLILLNLIFISIFISELRFRKSYHDESLSKDSLTGALNNLSFHKLLTTEIDRYRRSNDAFTLAYIDLDGLHAINEELGHATGDQVLHTTVSVIKDHLRKTDFIARLGGDEFSLLLPETGQEAAREVVQRVRSFLVNEMKNNNWSLSFSIGVTTYQGEPASVDELIKFTSDAMSFARQSGKDGICFTAYPSAKSVR